MLGAFSSAVNTVIGVFSAFTKAFSSNWPPQAVVFATVSQYFLKPSAKGLASHEVVSTW
jgi:hypothetical protein